MIFYDSWKNVLWKNSLMLRIKRQYLIANTVEECISLIEKEKKMMLCNPKQKINIAEKFSMRKRRFVFIGRSMCHRE